MKHAKKMILAAAVFAVSGAVVAAAGAQEKQETVGSYFERALRLENGDSFFSRIADAVKNLVGFGKHGTRIVEGDQKEYFSRIEFHATLDGNKNPGAFFDSLSLSALPDTVYFRNTYNLERGQNYNRYTLIYNPDGKRVKSAALDFTPSSDSWNAWYYWSPQKIFTSPGDWRVVTILTDEDGGYLAVARVLTVTE